jgi:hypothetical protein
MSLHHFTCLLYLSGIVDDCERQNKNLSQIVMHILQKAFFKQASERENKMLLQ